MPAESSKALRDRLLDSQQLSEIAELLQGRSDGIDEWLREVGSRCKDEQKHCEEGTVERVYWHYGYMVALRDALNLIKKHAVLPS